MILVHAALAAPGGVLPQVAVPVERRQLARRRWRATAADGQEFGFELERPLRHGDVVHEGVSFAYVLQQRPESLLAVSLSSGSEAAALAGWSVGNLHFPVEIEAGELLVPDEPAARLVLQRMGLPFEFRSRIFSPRRVAPGLFAHGHPGPTPGAA